MNGKVNKIESYIFLNEHMVTIRFRIVQEHYTVKRIYAPKEQTKIKKQILLFLTIKNLIANYKGYYFHIINGNMDAWIDNVAVPKIVCAFVEDYISRNGQSLNQFV